jgi:hypothetical protein
VLCPLDNGRRCPPPDVKYAPLDHLQTVFWLAKVHFGVIPLGTPLATAQQTPSRSMTTRLSPRPLSLKRPTTKRPPRLTESWRCASGNLTLGRMSAFGVARRCASDTHTTLGTRPEQTLQLCN